MKDASGKSIFEGLNATGFSNVEEEQADKVKDVPFLLETRIKELGGKYTKADESWAVSIGIYYGRYLVYLNFPLQPKVVVDGHVITGQNPASAKGVGEAILKALN